jgi:hypothetical protein
LEEEPVLPELAPAALELEVVVEFEVVIVLRCLLLVGCLDSVLV